MNCHPELFQALIAWRKHYEKAAAESSREEAHRNRVIAAQYAMIAEHWQRDLENDRAFGDGLVCNAKSQGLLKGGAL